MARRIPSGARVASPSSSTRGSRPRITVTRAIFGRGRKVESVKVEEKVETADVEIPSTVIQEEEETPASPQTTSLALSTDESCDDDDEYCSYFDFDSDGMLAEPLEAAIPMDYYSLLQLDFDASSKDVKRQYRQLSLIHI